MIDLAFLQEVQNCTQQTTMTVCTNSMNSSGSIQEITDSTESTSQQTSSRLVSPKTSSGSNINSVITGPLLSNLNQPQPSQQQQASVVPSSSTIQYSAKIFSQSLSNVPSVSTPQTSQQQQQQQQLNNVIGSYLSAQLGQQSVLQQPIISSSVSLAGSIGGGTASTASVTQTGVSSEDLNKDIKPKFSRTFLKHLGREPHNYDKCPPTTHQTMAYNLVSQPHLSQTILSTPYNYQIQPGGIIQVSGAPPNQSVMSYNQQVQSAAGASSSNAMNLTSTSVTGGSNPNLLLSSIDTKVLTHSQSLPVQNQLTAQQKQQQRANSMPTAQNYPPMLASQNSPPAAIQQQQHQGSFHPATSSYKSYHSHQPQPYKIPSQPVTGYGTTGRSMRHSSPPHHGQQSSQVVSQNLQPSIEQSQLQLHNLQQQQQQHMLSPTQQKQRLPPHPTKEMFRSNSLPINATFPLPPKEESFAVPRYQAKTTPKLRTRSNSMIIKQAGSGSVMNILPSLHTTTSEPMLNVSNSALLAQLLTTNNTSTLLSMKQENASTSAIPNITMSQSQSHQLIAQQQVQQQQQQQHQQHSQSQQQQQQRQQHSPLYQQLTLSSPLSPTSSQLQLNQASQPSPQQQQQQQLPAMSSASAHNSVLSFAASSSSASYSGGISLPVQSLSPDSILVDDSDTPMSPISSGGIVSSGGLSDQAGSSSCSGGVGNKFHQQQQQQQQQARSDSQRRSGHIHAEQKRRYNIKNGFDMLHSLIPQLQQNPNAKLSKAAMLQKGAEYIKQLRTERSATNEQMDALRREIDALNNSLNNLQTALPASGAPVSRQRTGRVKEMYQQYVRQRTLDNWKFWIFGLIFEPLMTSFNQTVSVANIDDMCRSCQLWVDQHCSLVELRPAVSNKLRQLSTTTDILSDPPTSLQEEVLKAISTTMPGPSGSGGATGRSPRSPNLNSSGGF